MPKIFHHTFIVPEDAIDGNGHVNNVVYVQWMQDVAILHSNHQGGTIEKYLSLGSSWIVRSHQIEYLSPAFSGDEIEADLKFKNSFRFRPYCKLIFALNNMPRVDDKTDGFFRKIIILPCNRKFAEEEQDKNLKNKLCLEIDGVFQWALAGLQRLQKRGYFKIPETIVQEINEYRKEKNVKPVGFRKQTKFE